MKRKQLLKPGAVPTIFPKDTVAIGQRQSIRPRRTAYEKREHSRVIVSISLDLHVYLCNIDYIRCLQYYQSKLGATGRCHYSIRYLY